MPAYAWYALVVLTLVYVLNFLDRSLIYILFTPIKAEMKLSDLQLALLGTTPFVIFYTLLGIPFGRLAVMVGVGEATLGPAVLSLLSDYFPPRMRATVQGVYSSGVALESGAAFFLGGWIGQSYGWRWAFYLLGFPGLLLAAVVFFLREQPRGRTETVAIRYGSVPLRYLYVGYALFGLASNNLGIWVPTFFVRVHEWPRAHRHRGGHRLRDGRRAGHGPRWLCVRPLPPAG